MATRRFLRLTHNLVNISFIKNVEIYNQPPEFKIIVLSNDFTGVGAIGFGFASHIHNELKVSKNKNPEDYEIVSKWIEEESQILNDKKH